MQIVSSYGIELKQINKLLRPTIDVYRRAVSFCIQVFCNEWAVISSIDGNVLRRGYCETLIHNTKNNAAKYQDFDRLFYKLPSYLRRAVIAAALGHVSSYKSLVDNWTQSGCIGKKPSLQANINTFPTFYNRDLFMDDDVTDDYVRLKLFVDNDWKWVRVKLKHTDLQYLRNHFNNVTPSCPTLERKNKKWMLRFAFEENVTLNNTPLEQQRIMSVDLGINTDAVCCVMESDGTILAREFINFTSDKDYLAHTLNKIRKQSRLYGPKSLSKLWRIARYRNEEHARKVAKAITDLAVSYNVDVVVFEYLETKGKKKGSNKQKLHMWKKAAVQKHTTHKLHRNGIRMRHVCAYNTSRLAYDGSGIVTRGYDAGLSTYSLCRFTNGKVYNCDLSAAYNIGARYFIREKLQTLTEKARSRMLAEVPECEKRTQCTYQTLLDLNKNLRNA